MHYVTNVSTSDLMEASAMTKSTKLHYVPRKWHTRRYRELKAAQAAAERKYVEHVVCAFEEQLRRDMVTLKHQTGYLGLPTWLTRVVDWCDQYLPQLHLPSDLELARRLEQIRRHAMSLLHSSRLGISPQLSA